MAHAYNATCHDTTGYAPIDLMFGLDAQHNDDQPEYNDYVEKLKERLVFSYEMANESAKKATQPIWRSIHCYR